MTETSIRPNIFNFVDQYWDEHVMPTLEDYVRIPCKSEAFDSQWRENGYIDEATKLFESWVKAQNIQGLSIERLDIDNRSPVLFISIEGEIDQNIFFYGHLDKQPENEGWDENKGPWLPVVEDGKLYGRGSADDGYAMFSAITAIAAAQAQGIKHASINILIEASEESGSPDLKTYLKALKTKIGTPDIVIVLDSGCGNYDQLWCTTSLRGMVTGVLDIQIMKSGVHSGDASGVVPSTYRIMRKIMGRLEESDTGALRPEFFHVDVPGNRIEEANKVAKILGDTIYTKYEMIDGVNPVNKNESTLILNRTWRPSLCVTGMDGIPPIEDAGNVLRPYTRLKLSFRLPPTVDPSYVADEVTELLVEDPPYNAQVSFKVEDVAQGWNANDFQPWLKDSLAQSSQEYFGDEVMYMGEGGTIPLLAMLNKQFPKAQFLVTGVLGPGSNAHGPNEFLHLQTVKRVTATVASVLVDQAKLIEG